VVLKNQTSSQADKQGSEKELRDNSLIKIRVKSMSRLTLVAASSLFYLIFLFSFLDLRVGSPTRTC